MISYFVSGSGTHTIRNYLRDAGKPLANLLRVIPYEELDDCTEVGSGTCIFAALDQLSDAQRQALPALTHQLAQGGIRVLNDPCRVRLRYELLRTLYDTGHNAFNVYRAAAAQDVERFPVFVRDENLHNGNLTPLLYTREALTTALRGLMLRGRTMADLLIVEFCDTSDKRGVFRKYSAFKVGDMIIPRYLEVSDQWMIKTGTRLSSPQALAEDRAYLDNNPHEQWQRNMFALARIDYGRIDYAMRNDRLQVWEINTNPALGCSPPGPHNERVGADSTRLAAHKAIFHERFADALSRLAGSDGAPGTPVHMDDRMRRALRVDRRRARRRDRLAGCMTQVMESSWVQAAKPWLKGAAASVAPVIARIPRRP